MNLKCIKIIIKSSKDKVVNKKDKKTL